MTTDTTTAPAAEQAASRSRDELRELAARAGRELAGAPAEHIMRWALDTFGSRCCIASSMSDAVLAHLASTIRPGVEVLFVDTGYHFVETLGTRDAVAATLPLTVRTIGSDSSVADQAAEFGPDLWSRDPDLCCAMRKVQPFVAALADYDAWATGRRADNAPTGRGVVEVAFDETKGRVVVAPLARWTRDDVDAYARRHDLIVNPLRYDGYDSIGCWPCTARLAPGAAGRTGRWPGSAKSDCGIHS